MELPSTHSYSSEGPFYKQDQIPDKDAVAVKLTFASPDSFISVKQGWGGSRSISKAELIDLLRADYAQKCGGYQAAAQAYPPSLYWAVNVAPQANDEIRALKAELDATKAELNALKEKMKSLEAPAEVAVPEPTPPEPVAEPVAEPESEQEPMTPEPEPKKVYATPALQALFELAQEEPIQQMEYKPHQIAVMTDVELASHFTRITGYKELSCKCCKGSRPILSNWIQSIRKRCMKKDGLWFGMNLPKTCDKQQSRNSKNNPIYNPINNPAYLKIRSFKFTEEEKQDAIMKREELIKQIGVEPKPYRYKHAI